MHTDPIADLLTRIRNAAAAHHITVNVPHSKVKENILKIMKDKNIIEEFSTETEKNHKSLNITLSEDTRNRRLIRVSKPGQRIYVNNNGLKAIKSGLGLSIISTSKGLMTNSDAKRQNLGGEIICEIS
ncbi:MAG: 30S ribosomal protein S8 [bacterium]|nr:30S ribosomal protein S8 [bacterium]